MFDFDDDNIQEEMEETTRRQAQEQAVVQDISMQPPIAPTAGQMDAAMVNAQPLPNINAAEDD